RIETAIKAACRALVEAQDVLTELDSAVGDGDLGITLARGATAVREALPAYPLDDPPETVKALGQTLQRVLGGSSGPLYGVLFLRAGTALKTKTWPEAIREACQAISELGGAKPGERTMLDALVPFIDALPRGLNAAVEAAEA